MCLLYPVAEFVTKACDNKMLIGACLGNTWMLMGYWDRKVKVLTRVASLGPLEPVPYPVTGFVAKICEGQYLHLPGSRSRFKIVCKQVQFRHVATGHQKCEYSDRKMLA